MAGVPAQAIGWGDLAARASQLGEQLDGEFDFHQDGATFPFGAHIAVVEVDAETGKVRLLRHVAVDDCGTVLAPLLVEGQQHGGIAAGVGQALFEEVSFDADGNPVTSNLADYGIPTAAELPSFETHSTETPTPLNPLGAKGIGEAATIGATPAVQNAVIDAVAHLGVRHIDLPCTPATGVGDDPRRARQARSPIRGSNHPTSSPASVPLTPPPKKTPREPPPLTASEPQTPGAAQPHALRVRHMSLRPSSCRRTPSV